MPCALEAQTVIKTCCFCEPIPTCWRRGESKKPGVFQSKNQQHNQEPKPNQNKNNQPRKTPRKLRHFFLGSCRARSRLRRSSKRFVFEWQFPHIGEWVRAKTLGVFKTRQTQQQQTNTQPKPNQNNPKRHPGNYVKHYQNPEN